MRHEKLYLTDIVEAAQAIERFLTGQDFDEFEQNEMLNSAVLQKMTVIGEAAARLPREFTARFPDIPGWILSDFAISPCMSILPSAGILPGSPQWMTFPA